MSSQKVTDEQVFNALRKCMDPEIPVNVVDLGLIYNVSVHPTNDVGIEMTMTTRGCPLHDTLGAKLELDHRGQCAPRRQPGVSLVHDRHHEGRSRRAEGTRPCRGTERICGLLRRRRYRVPDRVARGRVWPAPGADLPRGRLCGPGHGALYTSGPRHARACQVGGLGACEGAIAAHLPRGLRAHLLPRPQSVRGVAGGASEQPQ